MSLVAFHYRSYGTFFLYSKRLHNLHGGFTHYRNYRANKIRLGQKFSALFYFRKNLNFSQNQRFLPIWYRISERIPISHKNSTFFTILVLFPRNIRILMLLDNLSQNKKEIGYERFQLTWEVVHNLFLIDFISASIFI